MDNLPSTHYHSPAVKGFNWEGKRKIDLSETALLAAAREKTGLDRFGDESFLPALRALLDALNNEAQLNPFGHFNAQSRILRSLENRLWANACFEAHPEIRRRKIPAPIVIIGPHRSGTTRMQRMLAADPRLQHLKTWEGFNPAPRPGQAESGETARREEIRAMLQAGPLVYPGAFTAHPMDADWPEEEMLLLNHAFCSFSFLGAYYLPSYHRWLLGAEKAAAYHDMADFLRLISWSRGDPEDKRWVLKNPQHMLDLGLLLKTFPDAKLVFTHRDPVKTVGSVLSLMWFYTVQHTDAPCRAKVREIWLDFAEQMLRRAMTARENIPAAQQFDVHYEEMNRDWRGTMARLYDFAGLDFTPEAEGALADWLAENQREGRHEGHRYALEDFGLTAEDVDSRMAFYRERYGIPRE